MDNQPDRYVVRLGGDGAKEMGFGDDLDEAIAYAADAAETNVDAEVWMMGTEERSDGRKSTGLAGSVGRRT